MATGRMRQRTRGHAALICGLCDAEGTEGRESTRAQERDLPYTEEPRQGVGRYLQLSHLSWGGSV